MSARHLAPIMALALANPALAQSENPILAEARAADAAMMAAQSRGDLNAMAAMIADDYAYIDIGGNRVDKAKLLSRREGDKPTTSEMTESEAEAIVLSPVTVLLRGKTEGTAYYFGGLPRTGATRWSAIWRKDTDGRWRVVSEQRTVVQPPQSNPPIVMQPEADIAKHVGTWRLATRTPMDMMLKAENGRLKASIADQFADMEFSPAGSGIWFNTQRPLTIVFDLGGDGLTITSWGSPTAGKRISK